MFESKFLISSVWLFMKEVSKVVDNAPKSKIRKLFDLAAGRSDVISLGIGQPDFQTPQVLIDGCSKAFLDRKTVYAPTRGLPDLLNSIAQKVKKINGIEADPAKNIIIANGGSHAITLAMAVILNPGDEIVLSSPNFVSYFYCSQFFYSKAVEIPRNPDFSPNFDAMKKKITAKTKAIIVCSPNNPTGYTYSDKDWEGLCDIAIEKDLYVISDECYEKFVYDGIKFRSPASMNGMADRTITLNAFSKTYAVPGLRMGYVIANEKIIDLMEKYIQYTAAGATYPTQFGINDAMKLDPSYFKPVYDSFIKRRDFAYKRLTEIGFDVVKPKGAFYIMPSVKKFKMTGDEFSMKLMKDQAVAVVPGDIFGSFSANHVRISYATEYSLLEKAFDRMAKFVKPI
jgi:aminotransferase